MLQNLSDMSSPRHLMMLPIEVVVDQNRKKQDI